MNRKIGSFLLLIFLIIITGCSDRVQKSKITEEPKAEKTTEKEETQEEENEDKIINEAVVEGMTNEILSKMTLEEKVGQLFIVSMETLDKSEGDFFEFRELTEEMKKTLKKYPIGGVVLFSRNIETREQTQALIQDLQENCRIPMFISVDEEGGDVSRIAANDNMRTTKFPTMEQIGASEDYSFALQMGQTLGKEIKELGFNLNFAPVADVKTEKLNMEIGSRSFGEDEKVVSKMVKQVVTGLQSQGVSATLKHFPGHGAATEDSHKGAVNVDTDLEQLRAVDFVPFKTGIKAGADLVMISHLSISRVTEDTVPATLSPLVISQILRKELGFQGIAISDAMNMKAITDYYDSKKAALLSFGAGMDIMLMPQDFEEAYLAILNAVKEGDIPQERLEESVKRILRVKIKRQVIPQDTQLLFREPVTGEIN